MSKKNKNMNQLVSELIRRLEEKTGVKFEAAYPASDIGDRFITPQAGFSHGEGGLTVRVGETELELVFTSPKQLGNNGLEPLTSRLLQALIEEIWASLVRGHEANKPEFASPWERLLRQAIEERWTPERFEAASQGLGTLAIGVPVLVQCATWAPQVTDFFQGLFPDIPVRLVMKPDIFLFIPLDREEAGSIPQRTKANTLINEIYSLLADELGVRATVLVGDAKETNLLQSLHTVKKLADLQRRFFPGSPGLTVWHAGFAALLQAIPSEDAVEFADRVLGRLNKELSDTLAAFLAKDMNLADTSRGLFIHRNTLIYRLDRIEELTGYNPRRLDEAVNLYTALWLKQQKYLK